MSREINLACMRENRVIIEKTQIRWTACKNDV